jgi:tyrosinase
MTSQDKSVPQRESLWAIEARYKDGTDKATLQTLVKAFKGIQKLPPDDPRSFFRISGFHGIPFRGPGVTDGKNWWGGYCHHGDVLFPSWHRAYVLRLENALRSIPGAENLRLPYWDELIGYEKPKPLATRRRLGIPPARVPPKTVPTILTSPEFENEPNPLYSYTLQEAFVYKVEGGNQRYSKPVGYETRRYPLAGLVGTKEDEKATKIHNDLYSDQAKNVTILNQNVANWLEGLVDIPDDDVNTPKPSDVTSVYERILKAIIAPNYTVFSNTTTQSGYNNTKPSKLAVSLESPHNSIHLSVGGFYQKGKDDGYNADPIRGANGEMGNNETAAFDPIFYFHHCFVDYLFWKWQELHDSTTKLEFKDTWGGTKSNIGLPVPDGAPPQPKGTPLTLETPLYPFLKEGQTYFTTNDLVDIKKVGYDYGPGRLDAIIGDLPRDIPEDFSLGFSSSEVPSVQEISRINSADYTGSYVVRLYGYAKDKEGKSVKVEVGREAVLSRLKLSDCPNCESNAEKRFHIPLHQELIDLDILEKEEGEGGNYRTSVGIHTHEGELFPENLSHLPTPVVAPL